MKKPAKELVWIWALFIAVIVCTISECSEKDETALLQQEQTAIVQTV